MSREKSSNTAYNPLELHRSIKVGYIMTVYGWGFEISGEFRDFFFFMDLVM